jgi:signal transduction histidine kinase
MTDGYDFDGTGGPAFPGREPTPEVFGADARPVWETALLGACGAYAAVGVLETIKVYLFRHIQGIPKSPGFVFLEVMPWWTLWMPLLPVVLWLARRYRFDSPGWLRNASVHLVWAIGLSVIHVTAFSAVYRLLMPGQPAIQETLGDQVRYFMARHLFTDLVTYCATIGVYLAFVNFTRYRRTAIAAAQSDARAARLQLSLSEARLQTLRMELNPHFLFNALNAVAGLVRRREHDAAIETLSQLGELLRTTLNREMPAEVPLVEEMELLDRFLSIERVRFGERLNIAREIEPEAQYALVPPLILQPIVENALKHGIARRTGPAFLEITARRVGTQLELSVRDSGAGLSRHGRPPRDGVGLSNTKARLEQLYGAKAYMVELSNEPGGGARARVVLPWHLTAARELVAASA